MRYLENFFIGLVGFAIYEMNEFKERKTRNMLRYWCTGNETTAPLCIIDFFYSKQLPSPDFSLISSFFRQFKMII